MCNGHLWRSFGCSDFPVMCVDCDNGCVSCMGGSEGTQQYIVSPCRQKSKCLSQSAAYSIVKVDTETFVIFPELIEMKLYMKQYSLDVEFNITSTGMVFCDAVLPGSQIDRFALINKGQSIIISTLVNEYGDKFNITLEGLSPSTLYDVYCFSKDFNGNEMDQDAIDDTKMSNSTDCCREI